MMSECDFFIFKIVSDVIDNIDCFVMVMVSLLLEVLLSVGDIVWVMFDFLLDNLIELLLLFGLIMLISLFGLEFNFFGVLECLRMSDDIFSGFK